MVESEPLVHPDADSEYAGVAVAMRELDVHAVMVVDKEGEGVWDTDFERVRCPETEGLGVVDRVEDTLFDTVIEGVADRVEETEDVRQRVEEAL